MIRIYNTLTRTKVKFEPLSAGKVKMYACGITPYDEIHIGHARQAVVYDVIRNYFEYSNFEVAYVRNFTDVDDKIIAKAAAEERLPEAMVAVPAVLKRTGPLAWNAVPVAQAA